MQTIFIQNTRRPFISLLRRILNEKLGVKVNSKCHPCATFQEKFHSGNYRYAKLFHPLRNYAVDEEDGFQMVRVKAPPGAADSITPGHIEWEKTVGSRISVGDVVCRIRFREDRTLEIKSPVAGILAARRKHEGETVQHGDELFKVRLEFTGGSKVESKKRIKPRDYFDEEEEFVGKHLGVSSLRSSFLSRNAEKCPPEPSTMVDDKSYDGHETERLESVDKPLSQASLQPFVGQTDILPHPYAQPITTPVSQLMTTINEVNMGGTLKFLNEFANEYRTSQGQKPAIRSMYIKAAAHALKMKRSLNVKVINGERVERDDIEISVGIRHLKVLVFHTMKGIDKMSYTDITRVILEIEEQVSTGTYKSEKLERGFTVANEWYTGSVVGTPNYSKTCTLGLHNIVKRPILEGDKIIACPMMYVSLTYDRNVIDDLDAIDYLKSFKLFMEDPRHMLVIG